MSKQLSLVDYPSSSGDFLHEPEKAVISSTFAPDKIVEEFEINGIFEKFKLFEDAHLDSFVEVTRIKDDRIGLALKTIESNFIRLLESDKVANIKKIQSDNDVDILMLDFNAITSIYRLLKLKRDNFSGIATSVIKLG
jgi:hypothetical protein